MPPSASLSITKKHVSQNLVFLLYDQLIVVLRYDLEAFCRIIIKIITLLHSTSIQPFSCNATDQRYIFDTNQCLWTYQYKTEEAGTTHLLLIWHLCKRIKQYYSPTTLSKPARNILLSISPVHQRHYLNFQIAATLMGMLHLFYVVTWRTVSHLQNNVNNYHQIIPKFQYIA